MFPTRALLACALALVTGCGLFEPSHCGTFESNTPGWGPIPAGYEPCGADDGTSGADGDDILVSIQPNANSDDFDDDLEFTHMLVTFEFPTSELVENHTVTHLSGGAFMGLAEEHTDETILTRGTLRIGRKVSVDPGDGSIIDTNWEMTWDLTYGQPGAAYYHATGSDEVTLTHFAARRHRP